MPFQFGFSTDAEDDDAAEVGGDVTMENKRPGGPIRHSPPIKGHAVRDMLDALPERISFSFVKIESPMGKVLYLPRRDLHDVKVQLLCEEDSNNDDIIDQIEKSDLRSGVYEGGFKTWECSLDLASLLLDRGPRKDIDELVRCDQIIELGAGTAMPTLILFQHAISNDIPLTFTLADFNETVLRLVTLPNVFLTWVVTTTDILQTPKLDDEESMNGDLEISPEMIESFQKDLKTKMININLLSGPWSPQLASHIPSSAPDMGTVVLAAETVYSPASTAAFVSLLVELLKRIKMSKAMVAAKRVYFGVGGSVDGLKVACREQGAVAYEIENHGVPGLDRGVGRALIEVQMF